MESNNYNSGGLAKNTPYGITTGSAATAAALAAFLTIKNKEIDIVTIFSPFGKLNIHIHSNKKLNSHSARSCVIKMPYNDPDVTKNLKICAQLTINDSGKITIIGGEGVGIVTKPGLQIPVGKHAINPIPHQMIKKNIKRFLPDGKGANITIFVPKGEQVSKKTMNSRLGIIGGISILGTTGIARPMSSKAYRESLACQIDVAVGEGYKELVFVPGNIGKGIAHNILDVHDDQIIQMGNFVGFMLDKAHEIGVKKITILGHAGKIIKIAAGIFNTKNSVADGRKEIIAAYSGVLGADRDIIARIFNSKTTENMIDILDEKNITNAVFNQIAQAVKDKCEQRANLKYEIIIVKMNGNILNL